MQQDEGSPTFSAPLTLTLLLLRTLDEDIYDRLTGANVGDQQEVLREAAAKQLRLFPKEREDETNAATGSDGGVQTQAGQRSEEPEPSAAVSMKAEVARLLLHTGILEAPAAQIHLHARATTVTVTPEIEEPGDGPMTREEALKLLRAGNIRYFNRRRAETDYQLLDLSGVDLHQLNLTQHLHLGGVGQVAFNAATLGGDGGLVSVDLRKVVLVGANLSQANLTGAVLSEADLSRADLSDADLRRAVLRGANLTRANLWGANLSEADLGKAVLRRGYLPGIVLREADLSGADLSGAEAAGANLTAADLSGADLSDADLRGGDLRGADLTEADLTGADLRRADLTEANLARANLWTADLTGANLSAANLNGAACRLANLAYADLAGATLLWAKLEEALNLEIANFYETALKGTILEGKGDEKINKQDNPEWTTARRRFLDDM